MKAKAIALLLLLPILVTDAVAQSSKTTKQPTYLMSMKAKPKVRLTTRWAFVFDTSQSINIFGLHGGVLKAFVTATSRPVDQFRFCMYAFNDKGCWTYRKWSSLPARLGRNGKVTKRWRAIVNWLYHPKNTGTMSFGGGAINAALHQKVKKLTVIIISDGGFTEGGKKIKAVIKAAQAWRVKSGYGKAVITTIGIENMACRPLYPKPTNKTCQGWMSSIGKTGHGGYFYIYKKRPKKKKSKKKKSKKRK